MKVPFNDLLSHHRALEDELKSAINSVIDKSAFIRGEYVEKFEQEYSDIVGRKHCISCANGTDSLFICMKALGIKPGDEVIVPSNSWISTSETVTLAGGQVIFCDIDRETYTLNPDDVQAKITSKTVGIIPVHLFGHPADMAKIMEIARAYALWVIEDCAQAHLSKINGQQVGSFGNFASYSFYPGKNLGAMGDAGAITTDDKNLASKAAMFARHGGLYKGDHQIEGMNSRLDGIQAAILSVKLNHLVGWTKKRQMLAQRYSDLLINCSGVHIPEVKPGRVHAWHLYVIRTERRDSLKLYLDAKGISTAINYPIALPFLPAYRHLGHHQSEFPVASLYQNQILSLPLYPEMPLYSLEYVADSIIGFFSDLN